MPSSPVAYLLTFGTYGTRLHGDPRGTVDRDHNMPGEPFLPENAARVRFESALLTASPNHLTADQQNLIESITLGLADELGWTCHAVSAAHDHVHAVISAAAHGQIVRRLLKRRLSQALSSRWPGRPASKWWAEGGSAKWIWNDDCLRAAIGYVSDQRREERREVRVRSPEPA